jgi:hypothetical protein
VGGEGLGDSQGCRPSAKTTTINRIELRVNPMLSALCFLLL